MGSGLIVSQGQFRGLGRGCMVIVLATAMLAACSGGNDGKAGSSELSAQAQLGKLLFEDTALSASGQQSCASCHVESRAFAGDDALAVPLGGPNLDLPGIRNTPSIMYASFTPPFHFESDGTPVGGMFRDGRANTLVEQAMGPFLSPFEMANADAAELIARLKSRPYLAQFTALYGDAVLDTPDVALQRMGLAIAAYESEDPKFHPFDSKYDAWTAGKARFSDDELAGLAVFNDATRGNCAACHTSTPSSRTVPALFTDFTYDNLGVPRNGDLAVNDDAQTLAYVNYNSTDGVHRFYDTGLCGPIRNDLSDKTALCGAFKVPTLRNIALTAPYFHNGRFATLLEALRFYVTRDTAPQDWFTLNSDGTVNKFDDLPAAYGGQFVVTPTLAGSDLSYLGNVNTSEVPYERHLGEIAHLNAVELNQLLAFLCTLTDGYDPAAPASFVWPAQCPQAQP